MTDGTRTLADDLTHFQRRVIQDALLEATGDYWRRRADTLEAALPRPGDHPGTSTPQQRQARDQALTDAVQACRRKARILAPTPGDDKLLDALYGRQP